jgi:CheY-like chemotaxis protein
MNPLSILVVDDVEAFARLLADGLRESGHAVACASDGKDAAAMLGRVKFDLVITDIIMPAADGYELIDQVRKIQPQVRIIAMSGGGKLYDPGAVLGAAQQSGADAVLQKPFGPDVLKREIERLFG